MSMGKNPIPNEAIESFRSVRVANAYAGDPGEPDTYSVQELLDDANLAEGYCADVSDLFVAHLAERGIEARTIETSYTSWRGGQAIHYVVECDGWLIDWTASQHTRTSNPIITKERA